MLYLKPHLLASPQVLELITTTLAEHQVKIVTHVNLTGAELRSRRVIEAQYDTARHFACVQNPAEMHLTLSEEKAFRAAFALQPWEDAIASGKVYNEVQACALLGTTSEGLYELWESPATLHVRLRKGFYVAKLDRNCAADAFMRKKLLTPIFVVNGFYRHLEAQYCDAAHQTDFLVCEWNEADLSWARLLHDVIGEPNPAMAAPSSLRGRIFAQWEALGLSSPPNATHNCVHVSNSAFEGLTERLMWKKGSMLFTDLFGSRLLSVRIKSTQITEWSKNPIIEGKYLFEQLHGLNSTDCIAFLQKLSGGDITK